MSYKKKKNRFLKIIAKRKESHMCMREFTLDTDARISTENVYGK